MHSLTLPALTALLLALPAVAWADRKPNFDQDAKPILKAQPHLLSYIKNHFDVEETGYARTPGDDNHAPPPPYIFRARHRGANGPDNITLLIQPGAPGHILLVKEDAPGSRPPISTQEAPPTAPVNNPPSQQQPADNQPAMNAPAPTQQPTSQPASEPTSSTPSGPIKDSGSLAPPADPAPAQ